MVRGLTIIEALIAITVLIIGITALLYMFPISIQVERYSLQVSTALQLAQEKIEEELSKSYDNISVGIISENSLPNPFDNYSRETTVDYVDINFQATTTDAGIKKIKVEVSFKTSLNFEKKVEITTLIAKK